MVWGQVGTQGIEDLVRRIAANDPKLESLTILRNRRLTHEDVVQLCSALGRNTHLTELYASSHKLSAKSAAVLADVLAAQGGSLRSLCVGDSSFGDEGVQELSRGVASSSSLTRLDLGNKGVGPDGAAALGRALSAAAPLTHLILNGNPRLGDAGLTALCTSGGAQAWAGLQTLELMECGVTAAGLLALARSPNRDRLAVLHLEGNVLGPAGGAALKELLLAAPGLKELHLRGTELEDAGGEVLAQGLHASTSGGSGSGGGLACLDLTDCGLGPRTMAALRDAFAAGAPLCKLNLAGNSAIDDSGAAALGHQLASGTAAALEHLDLSGTQVGPQTVQALSRSPGLSHLSVVGCPLQSAGADALVASLCSEGGCWAELQELCLSGTGLDAAHAGAVLGGLTSGGAPKLKSLEIGANPALQDDGFAALVDTLRAARPEVAVFWRSGDDPVPVIQ
ncbi:Protein NLRC3 [Tetrabaena socialis]|uniref:Protein NLRC3 n=1 Tax=Tetrabaena socialis TaxID=47790 RepID=A0A2J8AJS9_9CHLO|nr:Protein NLRC3 [Tetrabaena socialis]|eukprot:PNH12768.1 Protein NLRC3 [Tetrabaena socialis]